MKIIKFVYDILMEMYGLLMFIANIPNYIVYYFIDKKIEEHSVYGKDYKIEKYNALKKDIDFNGYIFFPVKHENCYATIQEFSKKDLLRLNLDRGFIYKNIEMIGAKLDYKKINIKNKDLIQISTKGVALGYLFTELFDMLEEREIKVLKITRGMSTDGSDFILYSIIIYVESKVKEFSNIS